MSFKIFSDQITLVVTSCGQPDLLKRTLDSFIHYADIIPVYSVVIEDSEKDINIHQATSALNDPLIIINQQKLKQIKSIDKAYSFVKTPYIFHLEDDWEFFETGFMQKSLDVLEENASMINVNLRRRFDGTRGSHHPVEYYEKTKSGTTYGVYTQDFAVNYHGFAFNPGLRRLSDYKLIAPYSQHGPEDVLNHVYKRLGFRGACLELGYCTHIGEHQTRPGANQ